MERMISVASGFQYSVNIGYDLNNDEKIKNFIPTQSALSLLEEILLSTNSASTERARVLIGAYGKGKSHIVLMILSMLLKRDLSLFEKTMKSVSDNPKLSQLVENYYESEKKILPVVITGSNTSLTQAFLLALQRTLSEKNLMDVMPETNYKAAIAVIERWKKEFPDTYARFGSEIDCPVISFVERLSNYDVTAYERFERIYPDLTAGSVFNPFLGFDVVELYENAAKGLKKKGYSGIYVIYDEFSKYLEANITDASVSDTKMLQDFAEKCNRSGDLQMHLMLISHKEISNYIDKLPQQKVDGWRGVSERFKHIHLNNSFAQTYEIISSVIQKAQPRWDLFRETHAGDFSALAHRYQKHPMFNGIAEDADMAIWNCYPLHPVSTFVLPRLSERVAQNERTLFTFLSADGTSTLLSFLRKYDEETFSLITPDLIYDYFEPLFKKELYSGEIHEWYVLTTAILTKLDTASLASKIVKTLALIYILEQYDRLAPTKEELVGIYSVSYDLSEIEDAISMLIDKEFVVYLKRSNNHLRLKKTSGVNVKQKIADFVETQSGKISIKDVLNASNYDNYLYPSRYNDDREMTRYFSFEFVGGAEITSDINWDIKSEPINADGIIYGIIPQCESEISSIIDTIRATSKGKKRYIFVISKHYHDILKIVREYNAVSILRDKAADDPVLFDEYEVVFEDLSEIIKKYIGIYTQPETAQAIYIYDGEKKDIRRKAKLTELMSQICDEVYSLTPVINSEAVNRNEITNVSSNSRGKIIAGLLRNELEPNLGLSGNGQEVSIMRSTLIRTGIWVPDAGMPQIEMHPNNPLISNVLEVIEAFILGTRQNGKSSFEELYRQLVLPDYHIGLRRGLIPIFLAVVIHKYKHQIVISDRFGQVPTSADVLLQINADPEAFTISYLDWDTDKEDYILRLAEVFSENVVEAEKKISSYDYVANAMYRWFMALPKYSKESTKTPDGKKISKRYVAVARALRQNQSPYELLFKRIPEIFGYQDISADIAEDISNVRACYSGLLQQLRNKLVEETKLRFCTPHNQARINQMSLSSTIKEWCDSLDPKVFEQLFLDGTDKCLVLFKSITNDEGAFISRLAKLATDLRLEDWSEDVYSSYLEQIERYKKTAEEFHSQQATNANIDTSSYELSFAGEGGDVVTKRFERVDISRRGKLLFNQIIAALDSMGQSISEQEKRQILMEVLKKLC